MRGRGIRGDGSEYLYIRPKELDCAFLLFTVLAFYVFLGCRCYGRRCGLFSYIKSIMFLTFRHYAH